MYFRSAHFAWLLLFLIVTTIRADIQPASLVVATTDTSTIEFYTLSTSGHLEYIASLPPEFSFNKDSKKWIIFESALSPERKQLAFSAYEVIDYEAEEFRFGLFLFDLLTGELIHHKTENIVSLRWLPTESSIVLVPTGGLYEPPFVYGNPPSQLYRIKNKDFSDLDTNFGTALLEGNFTDHLIFTLESPLECERQCPAYRSEIYAVDRLSYARKRLTSLQNIVLPIDIQPGICSFHLSHNYERIFFKLCNVDTPHEFLFSVDFTGNVQSEIALQELLKLSDYEHFHIFSGVDVGKEFYFVISKGALDDHISVVRYLNNSNWEIVSRIELDNLADGQYLRDARLSPDGKNIFLNAVSGQLPYENKLLVVKTATGRLIGEFDYFGKHNDDSIQWFGNHTLIIAESSGGREDRSEGSISILNVNDILHTPVTVTSRHTFKVLSVGISN